MSLSRNLVDLYVIASAVSKIGYGFLGSQSGVICHHVKTSSLLNPTPVFPAQPVQATNEEAHETAIVDTHEHVQPEYSEPIVPPSSETFAAENVQTTRTTQTTPPTATISTLHDVKQESPVVTPEELESITNEQVLKAVAESPAEEKRRVLKESRIPITRAGRLWHYGTLATSMGLGALNESFKRATGMSNDSSGSVMLSEKNVDRLVEKLSRMRGAALKMGQMLSIQGIQAAGQGKSMMPPQLEQVLLRVHDSANYMPRKQMERVMSQELGPDWRSKFDAFDPVPIAAASIGQVHAATLAGTGQEVVVKIQYPGVAESIDSDLNNLKALVTFSNLLPRGLYLDNTIKVTKQELAWECDYMREADNAIRFGQLLEGDERYKVPKVIKELCSERVLVCERLHGRVLSKATEESQALRNKLGENLLRLCLREVFFFRFMQTDPNWSNFFYNRANGQIELLDFGACREFPPKFLSLYGQILLSASSNDPQGVWEYSRQLGFVTGYETEVMKQAHIDSVMILGEPFRSTAPDLFDFGQQTITTRIRETIPVMLRHRLTPPPDEIYGLHKKLSGAFLLCTKLNSQFDTKSLWHEEVTKKILV
ncbi:hypothetical protein EC973_006800 [Apophysomyces ossiformis]|uniref:ABC1 atypical kinase-like domain-containing protein n=1 Tax=Apophysomyces ossiformis TaxID=679940 RepID=A0A8H7BQQ5_9FUNG|nr:hypothetical protein EC973_006800 [Apophysomyces ossiformis]